ncbi:MAG: DNA-3-methyladenine glycosylase, partial [Bacteroidales bacterium]|nr:DNA-3-methyladenine glycosylase [Bacteroidales bacterium]
MNRINNSFFQRDVLDVAPNLLGKKLVRKAANTTTSYLITEVEAYRGEEDLACHASKGRTARTEIMYHEGGHIYMYLIYGMYWMLNFVTGDVNQPQAILIRGIQGYDGPGKLTKALMLDKSFYGESLENSDRLWVEDNDDVLDYTTGPRIGIDYSGDVWKNKP